MSRATLLSRTNSSRRPSTAVLLPNAAPLSDPARQAEFKSDLREVVQILIARHKNATAANKNNRIWFWGRSARFGNLNSLQTDFNAAGETHTVTRDVTTLPGHKVVEVSFSGIGHAAREPYPAPDDTAPPTTSVTMSPDANQAGWNNEPVTLDLNATDDLVGVTQIHVLLDDRADLTPDRAIIQAGAHASVTLSSESDYTMSYFAVDLLGNREPRQRDRRTGNVHGASRPAPRPRGLMQQVALSSSTRWCRRLRLRPEACVRRY